MGERLSRVGERIGEYAKGVKSDIKTAWADSAPEFSGRRVTPEGFEMSGVPDFGRTGRFGKNFMEARAARAAGGGDLTPGRTPLKEFDIDRYGSFNAKPHRGDDLAGHELLQNAWLREHGHSTRRGTGSFSRDNPAIALSDDLHARVGIEQRRLGLFDAENLRNMDADTNIRLNAEALRRAEVPEHVIQTLVTEATRHANSLP